MEHQATRACLAGFLILASAAACDVEPEVAVTAPRIAAKIEAERERQATVGAVMASMGLDTAAPIHAIFPAASCRSGFQQAGGRLCISVQEQGPATYVNAISACRANRSQVCSYEDLTYLYQSSQLDASYNPLGRWIGNMPADDQVFCGNASITSNGDPDIANFEGTCLKTDVRGFWCCHDDME